jgi:hypothetical protein
MSRRGFFRLRCVDAHPLPAFVLELIEFCELFVDCGAIPLIAKLMQKAVLLCFPCGCAKRKLPFEILPRVIGRPIIVRAPGGESCLGLQGPSAAAAELSPIPTAIPKILRECLVDCGVLATRSNYLTIERKWMHSRKGGSLLACLHPSKGATALQDTSALTKSPIFNQLLSAYGISFCSNRKSRDWSCYQNADRGDQLLSYSQGMNDKSQRVAGIFIAPLVMLTGLWLCLDGLEHGGLSGIFAIGPFVAVAGALWFVSDWF